MAPAADGAMPVLTGVGRGSLAAAALIAAQSIYWSDSAPVTLQVLVTAVGLLAWWRPTWGLLALAALAPFGRLIAVVWLRGYPVRGTEAFVLAFLAGVALRRLRDRHPAELPAWAVAPWTLFAVVILSSAAVLHRIWQVHHEYPIAFLRYVAGQVAFHHQDAAGDARVWMGPPGTPYVGDAIVVLAGLAVVLVTARLCQGNPTLVRRLASVTVAAGAVAGALSIKALLDAAWQSSEGLAALPTLLVEQRFAAHVTKVNTAGSYFVLVLPVAVGLAWRDRPRRVLWSAASVVLAVALWLTASLAAMLPAAVIAAAGIAVAGRRHRTRPGTRLMAAILVVAAIGAGSLRFLTREDAWASFQRRIAITDVSLRTAADAPFFGVGLGTFASRATPYITPEVVEGFGAGPVDPHNYVLEILAELGAVGLLIFIWAVGVAIGLTWTRHAAALAPWGLPAALGLLAFLTSALAGQPMQTDVVAMPAWMLMGLVLAQAPRAGPRRPGFGWVWLGVIGLLATVPARAAREVRAINPVLASHAADWMEDADGRALWRMSGRARLFVPADAPAVDIEARAADHPAGGLLFLRIEGRGLSLRPLELTGQWRALCANVERSLETGLRAVDLTGVRVTGAAAESEEIWVRVIARNQPCGVR